MGFIKPHGYYQNLESYQKSMVVYDGTFDFCFNFLKKLDRTSGQMVQAARSGKQNIVEGCMASGISSETEIRLIGVARASLEEVLEDYRDYLRTRHLALWNKDDARVREIRNFSKNGPQNYESYKEHFHLSRDTPELFCNIMITLIHQTNFLLDRQLKTLELSFLEEGGLRERMYQARIGKRESQIEEALATLREIYRDVSFLNRPDLLEKINHVAKILKPDKE